MNTWQLIQQVRYVLDTLTWGEGTDANVFGAVLATAQPTAEALARWTFPVALVRPGGSTHDAQEPRLVEQDVDVAILTSTPGDAAGERALVGGPRAAGVGSSDGRGLLEVEAAALAALRQLAGANGVRLQLVSTSAAEAQPEPDAAYVVARAYRLRGWVQLARHYPAPTQIAATGGSGQVALTWSNAPDRFDRYGTSLTRTVVRRASGTTPPASPTAGTGVALAAYDDEAVTDTGLAAGTYSYAIFATYDETTATPTTADRWSAQVTGTTAASVTVT